MAKVTRFYDGEILDQEATKKAKKEDRQAPAAFKKALLVEVAIDEFSVACPVEATEQHVKDHKTAYEKYLAEKEFAEFQAKKAEVREVPVEPKAIEAKEGSKKKKGAKEE